MSDDARPSWDDYYINIAWVVSSRSNCLRRKVGSIIVVERRIVSTGYNGTPFGVKNCDEGGCPRCASDLPRQAGYDWCLCVHAEQNAIALAARQGTATEGSLLYVTLRPCFGCLKEAVQAGIREVVYDQPFDYQPDFEVAYQQLLAQSGIAMRRHPYSATHPVAPVATPMTQGSGEEMPPEQQQ
ncbi:MAG TPA: dCMP deaminase family protein [Ktedonobacterales bacterium]|jgi:dCMP deaminase|nr:dCMP deaminase family protein [Ktedonobacterales bacterium]